MSVEQAAEFVKAVAADPIMSDELVKKIETAEGLMETSDVVSEFAESKGYNFTAQEAAAFHVGIKQKIAEEVGDEQTELSDEEMELVSGGAAVMATIGAVAAVGSLVELCGGPGTLKRGAEGFGNSFRDGAKTWVNDPGQAVQNVQTNATNAANSVANFFAGW